MPREQERHQLVAKLEIGHGLAGIVRGANEHRQDVVVAHAAANAGARNEAVYESVGRCPLAYEAAPRRERAQVTLQGGHHQNERVSENLEEPLNLIAHFVEFGALVTEHGSQEDLES